MPCESADHSFPATEGHSHDTSLPAQLSPGNFTAITVLSERIKTEVASFVSTVLINNTNQHDQFFLPPDRSEARGIPTPKPMEAASQQRPFQLPPSSTREYRCTICSKSYPSDRSLRRHRLNHQARQFRCPICAKSFKRGDTRDEHQGKAHPPSPAGITNFDSPVHRQPLGQDPLPVDRFTNGSISTHAVMAQTNDPALWVIREEE